MVDLEIIKRTFSDVKKFEVGAEKPNAKGVKAVRVLNIQPFFEYTPNRYLMGLTRLNRIILTIFDHDVKENLHPTARQTLEKNRSLNGLLLMKNFGYETSRAFASYTKTSEHPLVALQKTEQAQEQVVLGRCEYQYKREYDYFINTESQLRHNLLVYLKGNKARYVKPKSILIMSKKKSSSQETGLQLPMRISVDARGYTKEEIQYKNKRYEEIGVKNQHYHTIVTYSDR